MLDGVSAEVPQAPLSDTLKEEQFEVEQAPKREFGGKGFGVAHEGYPKTCSYCGYVAETSAAAAGHRNSKPKGKHIFETRADNGSDTPQGNQVGKAQFFVPLALRSRSPASIEMAGKHAMFYELFFKPQRITLSDFIFECVEDVMKSRGIDIGVILREDGQDGNGRSSYDRPDTGSEEADVFTF